ncbi:MAG: hypothetical protein AAF479_08200 [Pseudomonadota bacterium]
MTVTHSQIAESTTIPSELRDWTARQGPAVLRSAPVWMPLAKFCIEFAFGDTELMLHEGLWLIQIYRLIAKEATVRVLNGRNRNRKS